MTSEIFHDSNGFGISYSFVGMIMMVRTARTRAETKLLLCAPIIRVTYACHAGTGGGGGGGGGGGYRFLASLFMLSII